MLPARRTDHRRDVTRNAMGTVMRGPAAISQPTATALVESRQPFVASLAADAVAGAEFHHGVQVQPVIPNEALSLVHG
jgi:hypothetical protein